MESKAGRRFVSHALSKQGIHYQISLFLLPVLPLSLALLVWFVFFYEVSPQDAPIFLIVLTLVGALIVLHQEIDVIRFLRVASRTAKAVTLLDDGIVLTLFSNKTVQINGISVSNDADRYTKSVVHKRLFPKGSKNLSVFSHNQEYFISSTTDDFENLKRILVERSQLVG